MTEKPRHNLEGVFAAVLLAALLVTMTIQVVLRAGFSMTVSWLEEAIRIIFVWRSMPAFWSPPSTTSTSAWPSICGFFRSRGGASC